MRRTPECQEYYVKIYSGAYPTDYGFQSRYTIAVNYGNGDNSRSRNEYVCYLTERDDNIANVAIYGAGIRDIYNRIKSNGMLWGIEVSDCDWETDFVDVYFDLSNCWQDELPNPEEYHTANLYTFELETDEQAFAILNTPIDDEEMKLKWRGYCMQWDYELEQKGALDSDAFTYPPIGIELSAKDYTFYKKNNYNLNRIHAWCMSGKTAHEYMRNWIPSPGFSSDAPKDEIRYSNELGEYVPRAGFYKLIRRESDQNPDREGYNKYDSLVCYYTRSRDLEFVEEEVKIYEGQLYNQFSSHGPKNHRLQIGQILHVRRTILDQYLFDGEVKKAYSIDWSLLYEKRLPAIFNGPVSHASNSDHPAIKAILSKLYFRAMQFPIFDDSGNFDIDSEEYEIIFAGYQVIKDFKVPQEELEKQIFLYNEGQLGTLCQYLSCVENMDSKTREIIDDLCKKSPIIAPYLVRHQHTARFSVYPPKYYRTEKLGNHYIHYFNIFDYSISSDHGAYAELIIEGTIGDEYGIRYRKPCANDYLTGIFII